MDEGMLRRTLLATFVAAGCLGMSAEAGDTDLSGLLARLRIGMWARVEGQRTPDGKFEASRLRIYDGERDELEVETVVTAIDPLRLTLETALGLRVVATPSTELEGPNHQRHLGLAGVEVGDRIEVEGRLDSDGTLRAEKIDIEKPQRQRPAVAPEQEQHRLTARIESIDIPRQRLVVLGLPVQLRPTTRLSLPD